MTLFSRWSQFKSSIQTAMFIGKIARVAVHHGLVQPIQENIYASRKFNQALKKYNYTRRLWKKEVSVLRKRLEAQDGPRSDWLHAIWTHGPHFDLDQAWIYFKTNPNMQIETLAGGMISFYKDLPTDSGLKKICEEFLKDWVLHSPGFLKLFWKYTQNTPLIEELLNHAIQQKSLSTQEALHLTQFLRDWGEEDPVKFDVEGWLKRECNTSLERWPEFIVQKIQNAPGPTSFYIDTHQQWECCRDVLKLLAHRQGDLSGSGWMNPSYDLAVGATVLREGLMLWHTERNFGSERSCPVWWRVFQAKPTCLKGV